MDYSRVKKKNATEAIFFFFLCSVDCVKVLWRLSRSCAGEYIPWQRHMEQLWGLGVLMCELTEKNVWKERRDKIYFLELIENWEYICMRETLLLNWNYICMRARERECIYLLIYQYVCGLRKKKVHILRKNIFNITPFIIHALHSIVNINKIYGKLYTENIKKYSWHLGDIYILNKITQI